jgi:hypothetical protein
MPRGKGRRESREHIAIEAEQVEVPQPDPPRTPPAIHKTGDTFLDPCHPESRLIHSTLSDEVVGELNSAICQGRIWIEDDGSRVRANLRIQLFQALVEQCDQLDQKYSISSPNSYALTRDLFVLHPWLVLALENCWKTWSFATICRLGEYPILLHDLIGLTCPWPASAVILQRPRGSSSREVLNAGHLQVNHSVFPFYNILVLC